MASGSAGDGLFGNVFGGSISSDDLGIQRRPYHRNCNCALHKPNESHCSHQMHIPKVSFPIRRSWSEGCLVARTPSSAAAVPSPGSSPCCPTSPATVAASEKPPRLSRRRSTHQLNY